MTSKSAAATAWIAAPTPSGSQPPSFLRAWSTCHGAMPSVLASWPEGPRPELAASFVIPFRISHIASGPYGTELSASLPETLGTWGYLDRIKLTLRRKYQYKGRELSYFNAACPAPPGAVTASFPLATARMDFAGGERIAATVQKACRVSE